MRPLKFKEIRKSIINQQSTSKSPTKSPLRKRLFGPSQGQSDLSFRNIKNYSYVSPLKRVDSSNITSTGKKERPRIEESQRKNLSPLSNKKAMQFPKGMHIYETEKKTGARGVATNFNSEQKQNQGNSIYFNSSSNSLYHPLSNNTAINNRLTQRDVKTSRNIHETKPYYKPLFETVKPSYQSSSSRKNSNTNVNSMLFKNALETSNKKRALQRNNYDSDRTNDRQNSIGKLKQKLFGMKKIISQKENSTKKDSVQVHQQSASDQNTNSFSIYTRKTSKQESNSDSSESTTLPQGFSNFSNLTVKNQQGAVSHIEQSINLRQEKKDYTKGSYKNFIGVEEKKDSIFSKVMMNESRLEADSINGSFVSEVKDSLLDMSPHF